MYILTLLHRRCVINRTYTQVLQQKEKSVPTTAPLSVIGYDGVKRVPKTSFFPSAKFSISDERKSPSNVDFPPAIIHILALHNRQSHCPFIFILVFRYYILCIYYYYYTTQLLLYILYCAYSPGIFARRRPRPSSSSDLSSTTSAPSAGALDPNLSSPLQRMRVTLICIPNYIIHGMQYLCKQTSNICI